MTDIEIIKETSLCITITDLDITLDDGTKYLLGSEDKVYFTARKVTNNRTVVIEKDLANGIQIIGQNILLKLLPKDTAMLSPVVYDYDFKLDIKGKGEDVLSIVRGCLRVKSTVTSIKVGEQDGGD